MSEDYDNPTRTLLMANPREIEPAGFAALGNDVLAYIKPVEVEGREGFAVHAADGRALAVIHEPRDVVMAIVRQNDLEPVSVH
jgi:hypothetical protein